MKTLKGASERFISERFLKLCFNTTSSREANTRQAFVILCSVVQELYTSHTYGTPDILYSRMVATDDGSGTDVIVYPITAMEHQRCCKQSVADKSVLCHTDLHLSTSSFSDPPGTSFSGVVVKKHTGVSVSSPESHFVAN